MLRTVALLVLVGTVAAAAGLAARTGDGPVERTTVDARFDVRGVRPSSSRIAIVAYDNASLDDLGVRPPLPRATQARLVDALDRAGARVIAFDWSLEQPSESPGQDRTLALALMNARHAVVSVTAPGRHGELADLAGFLPFSRIDVVPGYTPLQLDGQGVVRGFQTPPAHVPSFSLAAVAALTGRSPTAIRVPGRALIDYPGPTGTVPALSYIKVLSGRFPRAAVAGRIVIVGPTATVLGDAHRVPVDSTMPGVEIHAAEMATALAGFPLRVVSPAAAWTSTVLLGFAVPALVLAGGLLARWIRTRRGGAGAPLGVPGSAAILAAGVAAGANWLVVAQVAFDRGDVVEVVPGLVAIVVATALVAVVAQRLSAAARRDLRRRFAAREMRVVDQILAARGRRSRRWALTASDVVAGYTITGAGMAGGMGVVYPAQQTRLARDVVIKIIRGDRASDARYRAGFVDEAYRAAGLIHPNIIPVYDAGEADRMLYLVMQRIAGADLRRWLAGSATLEAGAAVQMLHRVACALDYAYATQRLVHRDVKPENILIPAISPRHPFLVDFGVAGPEDPETPPGRPAAAGTAAYRAPRGHGTRAGDVYALAVVLCEAVTGRRPEGAGDVAVALLGPSFEAVLARGLAGNPAERFPTAAALTRAAAQALGVEVLEDVDPGEAPLRTNGHAPRRPVDVQTPEDGEDDAATELL
jgi:CHASE2 domain-containing sensor protein